MPCIELELTTARRVGLACLCAAAMVLGGCVAPRPEPAPAPLPAPVAAAPAASAVLAEVPPPQVVAPAPVLEVAPPSEPPRSAKAIDLGPMPVLPAATTARNWDDFKRLAARRMVAASPRATYMGKPPPILFGIPVLEVELNADGSVRQINITRKPSNSDAQDTIDYAMEAIRRGAPYGDVSRLPKPWKWTEVFLFTEKRQFKPRTLD